VYAFVTVRVRLHTTSTTPRRRNRRASASIVSYFLGRSIYFSCNPIYLLGIGARWKRIKLFCLNYNDGQIILCILNKICMEQYKYLHGYIETNYKANELTNMIQALMHAPYCSTKYISCTIYMLRNELGLGRPIFNFMKILKRSKVFQVYVLV
jgi:hypothetical protein